MSAVDIAAGARSDADESRITALKASAAHRSSSDELVGGTVASEAERRGSSTTSLVDVQNVGARRARPVAKRFEIDIAVSAPDSLCLEDRRRNEGTGRGSAVATGASPREESA